MAGEADKTEDKTVDKIEEKVEEKVEDKTTDKVEDKVEAKTDDPAGDKKPWWNGRIDRLTREKNEGIRRVQALESMVAELQKGGTEKPKTEDLPKVEGKQFTQAEIDQEVERRATNKAAENEFNRTCNTVYETGKAAHDDYDKALQNFQKLGGLPVDTTQMILETDNPSEVLYALGNDLDEAQRIMELPPIRRAAALIKYGVKLTAAGGKKEEKISGALPPIKPPRTGGGKGDTDLYSDSTDISEWMKQRNKDLAQKRA